MTGYEGENIMATTEKFSSFTQWMRDVDALICKRTGVFADDLPDCCYRQWYDDGYTVKHAASAAIKNARE